MAQTTQPRAVFLIGFMGAGKTTVGKALAQILSWRFVDLDDRIEAREQRTIAQIFAESGEDVFRRAETAALRELLLELQGGPPAVVALGGGAPVREENAGMLSHFGAPCVFLDTAFETACDRCRATGATRPLFQRLDETRGLYEARRPLYLRADLRIETDSCSIEEAAARIAIALALDKSKGE